MSVRVEGLSELAASLRALPAELASKNGGPLARALAKGARTLRDEAKSRAPVSSGRLQRSIIARRNRNPKATEQYDVFSRAGKSRDDKNGAYYAQMVEYGTKAIRRPKKKKVLSDGETVFGTEAAPIKRQPFMRPAWTATKDKILTNFKTDLAAGISRAAKKVRQ